MLLDEKLESLFRDGRFSIAKKIKSSSFRFFHRAISKKMKFSIICNMPEMEGKYGQPCLLNSSGQNQQYDDELVWLEHIVAQTEAGMQVQ